MSGVFKASIVAVVVVIILVLFILLLRDDHTCHKCNKCWKSKCRTGKCHEQKCKCRVVKEGYSEPEHQASFYKRIEKTAEDMVGSGNFPTSAQDWQQYLSNTFVEPEVHESHEKYMTEAIQRTQNPSKWTTTDNNTGYNTRFVGLARPRRVPVSENSQLVPDENPLDYRDPTPNQSQQGLLEGAWGYSE